MTSPVFRFDTVILGAGAAGLMCAATAGQRGRKVVVIEQSRRIAEKIRISGGGRCNFTNLHTAPANFLSQNPQFCKSALKRFTQHDFIALVQKHRIAFHEKTLGQLFCDDTSQQIIDMLLSECSRGGVQIRTGEKIMSVSRPEGGFRIQTDQATYECMSLVVATGGPSIPKIGASAFGYKLGEQFGLGIVPPRAALVPLTFAPETLAPMKELAGLSVDAVVSCGRASFREGLLFTHRGLSGPSILQISSYWKEGQDVVLDLCPSTDVLSWLKDARRNHPRQELVTVLSELVPRRLAQFIVQGLQTPPRLADFSDKTLQTVVASIKQRHVRPHGTEGYRTAEVTLGGVDTSELSSKTMECRNVPGLFFIGEVVDVTGHLGGFNFQWAWSSGYAAGQFA